MPNALWVWDVPKLCLTAILLQSNSVRGLYNFAYIYVICLLIVVVVMMMMMMISNLFESFLGCYDDALIGHGPLSVFFFFFFFHDRFLINSRSFVPR